MARPTNGWGEPSYSQDIVDNYMNTHHEDENGDMIKNNAEYLDSLEGYNYSPSDGVVHYAYGLLNDIFFDEAQKDEDTGYELDDDGFYIIPEHEYFNENNYDGHGNYMDDDYFFKRDYEGESCSLYPEDEDCAF